MSTRVSRTATSCHMEEVGARFQGWDLRAGTLTSPTSTHTLEVTCCRAGWGWWIQTCRLLVLPS